MSRTLTASLPSPAHPRRPSRTWAASLLCLGLISCVGPESALAQPKILVLMKNGDQWEQGLPDVRKMVFQNPNLVFTLANGSTHLIVHADIRRITFQVPTPTQGAGKTAEKGKALSHALEARASKDGLVALSLALPAAAMLRLQVLFLDGAEVRTLADGVFPSGNHALSWDGRDHAGRLMEPGAFLVVATTAGKALTRKILWLRQVHP